MGSVLWTRRAALAYAVGVWTMFGYGFYAHPNRNGLPVEMPVKEEDNRPNVKKYETTHFKTTVVYKENFVPLSTMSLNLFRSTNESEKHEEEE